MLKRPDQLEKLAMHNEEIANTQQKIDANNERNLDQIDQIYKETTELENQFIGKKTENMNLINESEMNGIRFLNKTAENNRGIESVND